MVSLSLIIFNIFTGADNLTLLAYGLGLILNSIWIFTFLKSEKEFKSLKELLENKIGQSLTVTEGILMMDTIFTIIDIGLGASIEALDPEGETTETITQFCINLGFAISTIVLEIFTIQDLKLKHNGLVKSIAIAEFIIVVILILLAVIDNVYPTITDVQYYSEINKGDMQTFTCKITDLFGVSEAIAYIQYLDGTILDTIPMEKDQDGLYRFTWDSSQITSLNANYYIDIKVIDNYLTHNEGTYDNIGIFTIK